MKSRRKSFFLWPSIVNPTAKIAPLNSTRMHLPASGATAVQQAGGGGANCGNGGGLDASTASDWGDHKGGMLEPPGTSCSGSPPGSQDLWWTERLVFEAQQEYPGELGGCDFSTSLFPKQTYDLSRETA